jgi:hypothetical protein
MAILGYLVFCMRTLTVSGAQSLALTTVQAFKRRISPRSNAVRLNDVQQSRIGSGGA